MRLALVFLLATVLTACTQPPTTPPVVDLAQEEAAIRAADAAWLAAAKAHDLEKTVNAWTEDAVIYPANAPEIHGRAAIREYVRGAFRSPDFAITWKTEAIHLAAAGDLAYQLGTDQITYRAGSKLVTENNRAVVVWRKQSDGSWKAAVDIWNAGAPRLRGK